VCKVAVSATGRKVPSVSTLTEVTTRLTSQLVTCRDAERNAWEENVTAWFPPTLRWKNVHPVFLELLSRADQSFGCHIGEITLEELLIFQSEFCVLHSLFLYKTEGLLPVKNKKTKIQETIILHVFSMTSRISHYQEFFLRGKDGCSYLHLPTV
jgi:hypothetical protein